MTYKLLIVDDERPNLRLLERLFRHDYYCLTASSGEEAIQLLEQHDVATIITDQRMPQLTGIELLKRTAQLRPHMVRILLTGYTDTEALVEAINCGLVYMYVTKPWNNDDLKLRVSRAIEHYINNRKRYALEIEKSRLERRIGALKAGFVRSFAEAMKVRNSLLHDHSNRVSRCAEHIARQIGLDEESCRQITAAAMLHDLDVLCRDGATVCRHSIEAGPLQQAWSGRQLFAQLPEFTEISDVLRFQQENYNGTGKPRGLIGDQIPIGARIIRIAAQYDLLRSSQTNAPLNHPQAVQVLTEKAGSHLDSSIVKVLAEMAAETLFHPVQLHGTRYSPDLLVQSVN
jgi:response regulator RpfG family c-di-GMP phosphodiesterase